ncbi:MAG: peptidylprolyl isomerase, partial [Pikeienuella sp.]
VVVAQIVWNRVVTSRFNARATPSEGELDTEIEIAASATEQRFRVSEIALPATDADMQKAADFLNKIRRDIAAGANFADIARKTSRSPTARKGGDIGWLPQSSLPPAMSQALIEAGVGGVTPPLPVPGGVAIFQLRDSEATAPSWTKTTTYSLQRVSAPLTEGAVDRVAALMADVTACGDLPELDEDISTARLNDVKSNSIAPNVLAAIQPLKAGEKTAPIPSQNTMDAYIMCSKRTGVPTEIREQIREQIRGQRLTRLAEGFLQEQRRDAVIERR